MSRWLVLAFGLVVIALVVLATRPGEERAEVRDEIVLRGAEVRLYPDADPEATWRFAAPQVTYDPGTRETVLERIEDGERRVGDEVDFTLVSERLVIGRDDDLRSRRMDVHLVEDDLDVEMVGSDERLVLVDQREGRFEVPDIRIFGEDFGESRYQDMRVSFDFTDFQAGGPGTVGYSEFEIEEPGDAGPEEPDDAI